MLKNKYLQIIALVITSFTIPDAELYSQDKKEELPEPVVITPGKKAKPPSDAIIIFDKQSLTNFEKVEDGSPAGWNVSGNKFTVAPGTGSIQTKQKFGDCQLHIEWRTPPKDVKEGKEGQQCGNSGVYLMGKYEVQVLNSYLNKTYADGQAGAIYGQHPPLVNASLKPGKWQVYDIVFTAPRFNGDGTVKTPGYMTVFHNGVLVQNHAQIKGATRASNEKSKIDVEALPLMLQDHSNEVSYRNIWIREL
jgi:hypothetical protein